jgi:hypothetical protein
LSNKRPQGRWIWIRLNALCNIPRRRWYSVPGVFHQVHLYVAIGAVANADIRRGPSFRRHDPVAKISFRGRQAPPLLSLGRPRSCSVTCMACTVKRIGDSILREQIGKLAPPGRPRFQRAARRMRMQRHLVGHA